MPYRVESRPLWGILIAAVSLTASAQQVTAPTAAAPPRQEPANLERVEVTANRGVEDRKDASTIKTVVTSGDIARYGDTTVTDTLRRVPGITVSGVPGKGGEIRMQGLGSGYTQILINGEPTAPGFSIDSLSPSVVDRIEILRSPTADLSAQSIAGSINIILKQTVRPASHEVKATIGGYAGNPSYYLNGQLADRLGRLSYTLAGGLSRENNTWPSVIEQNGQDDSATLTALRTTVKTEFARDDTVNFAPRIIWKPEGGDEISGEMLVRVRQTDAGTIDQRSTAFGTPPLYAANDLRLDIDMTSVRAGLNWLHKFTGGGKLDVKGGVQYSRRKSVAKFFGFDEVGRVVLDEDTTSDASDKSLTLNGKYRAPSSDSHAIALGWDGEYSQRSEDRIQRQSAPVGYPAVDLDEVYDARVERLAVYAQDEWTISEGLSGYLGLRWEKLETRSVGNLLAEVKNRSSVVSPMMQAVWKLPNSNNDQIRLGLARTYRAPSTRQLMPRRYVANDNTPTTPDLQGNPDLRPELAWGVDLAYEHYFGKAGLFSLGANARRIDDVILQQLSYIGGSWVSTPANSGKASMRGVQMEMKLSVAKVLPSLPDMDLRASAGWNWSTVESVPGPNNRLDKQVPFVANVGIDYRASTFPLTIGGNFTFQQGGPVTLSANQTAAAGVKRLLDLYGLWKLSAQTQLRLVASNVLRQDYASYASYFDDAGRFDQVTRAATNRTIKLTLEHRF